MANAAAAVRLNVPIIKSLKHMTIDWYTISSNKTLETIAKNSPKF